MVRKAFFWTVAGQFSSLTLLFVGSIIIARLLSPREMGVYAIAQATIGILQLVTAFNVGLYVIREKDLTPRTVDAAFTMNAALSLALALVIFLVGSIGARYMSEPGVADVLRLLSILPIFGIAGFRPSVMLQRAMLFRGPSIIGALGAAISTCVTIAAAYGGASYMSPAYGAVASSIFTTAAIMAIGFEHVGFRLSLQGWREIMTFGLRLLSIGGISVAASRLGDFIIAYFLGLAALGLYSRASEIGNMLVQNVYGTATRVVFAQLSAVQRNQGQVGPVFLRGFRLIVGVMGPIFIGMAILAKPTILLMYGEKWLESAVPLSLVMVALYISMSFAMNWELFVVKGELARQTRLEVTRSVVAVATTTVGSTISLVAVAWSGVVDSLISILLYGRHMPRLAGTSASHMLKLYGEASMLTAAATMPALMLMLLNDWDARTSLPAIMGSVLLGGILWLVTLAWLKHPLVEEMKLLAARLRRKVASD